MSSITTERDANGRAVKFVARYRTPEGASRKQRFTKRADAQAFLDRIGTTKATGTFVDSKNGRMKFGDYAREWMAMQPHRPNTVLSVESAFRVHILPTFEDRTLGSIRRSQVQSWVTGLELAPSTTELVYSKLAAVMRSAALDKMIAETPCVEIKLPSKEAGEVDPMAPAEIAAMVGAVNPRFRALLLTLAGTGLRPGEALGLMVARVNFLKRTIRVEEQLVTMPGKAPEMAPTKTKESKRTIAVPQSVLDALAAHIAEHGTGPGGLIFTDTKGDPIRRSALGHVWRRAATKAKVADRTPHDLRHYAASVMIASGASVKQVQRHLGHKTPVVTLNVYSHLFPESDDLTRRALDAAFSQIVSTSCPSPAVEA